MAYVPIRPRLLIADDSDTDQYIVRRAIRSTGVEVEVDFADDGIDLIEQLTSAADTGGRRSLPTLVLLDLNMPRMDGRGALEKVRNSDLLKHLPVVILSTSDADKDVFDCYRLGANMYLSKPMDYPELVEMMRDLFRLWFECAKLPRLD